ncbi:MAG: LON peptidase substrate-binding domain-containing protein [Candidatus Thiodiazotropha sp. 6PLUC9]
MTNRFITDYQHLPDTIPIFPLSGAIVMPGAQLPLNIFEPRYLNMIEDAMASHHLIGMVQPKNEQGSADQAVFSIGGCGRITYYNETNDGRIEVVLTGVCRFEIIDELTTTRGYRLISPSWERFKSDYDQITKLYNDQRRQIEATLDRYLFANNLKTDSEQLKQLPTDLLVNVLTTSLPLGHEDKQSILEAVSINDRLELLITKMGLTSYPEHNQLRH